MLFFYKSRKNENICNLCDASPVHYMGETGGPEFTDLCAQDTTKQKGDAKRNFKYI